MCYNIFEQTERGSFKMEKNEHYIGGIIGSLIGGLIATVPWILMYVYGEMMLSILAIFIAMGALKGYQLGKGKITTKLPIIIIVVSLISVTLATLVIIPLALLAINDARVTMENLNLLYSSSEFTSALMRDYIISVAFTILGISGVISTIKNQLKTGEPIKVSFFRKKKEQ